MKLNLSKNKKIILGIVGILSLGSLSSLSLVSCSNNKSPNIKASISYCFSNNVLEISNNGNLYCTRGDINGFKTAPTLDNKNSLTYEARNKFYSIQMFNDWFFPFMDKFQYFLSVWTVQNISNSLTSKLSLEQKQTAIALATPLNQGTDTLRYGLQSVSFNEPSWPAFTQYINSDNKSDVNITFNNISLTFNWWTSTNGSNVVWMNKDFNPNNELSSSPNWYEWTNKGIVPPTITKLNFNKPISISLTPQIIDNKTTGVFNINSNISLAALANSASEQAKNETKQYTDILDEAYKVAHGDINNVDFKMYYEENINILNTILSWFNIISN